MGAVKIIGGIGLINGR